MTAQNSSPFARLRTEEIDKLRRILNYAYDARSNYVQLHRETLNGFSHHGRWDWAAVDGYVRIAAAGMLLDALHTTASTLRRTAPYVSSVVVTSDQWLAPLYGAHDVDIAGIRETLRATFRGLDYVGMIEPGFYPRRRCAVSAANGTVSWHFHALFWGADREALSSVLAEYNRTTKGPLYGVPPASFRRRSWKSASAWVCYMLKTPSRSYTTRRIPERIDQSTGEVIPEHDRQLSQQLRPGQHVHMRNVLREFTVDDLLMVAGSGRSLVQRLAERIVRDRQRGELLCRAVRKHSSVSRIVLRGDLGCVTNGS